MKFQLKLVNRIFYLLPRIIVYIVFILFLIIFFLVNFAYFEPYLYPLHLLQGKAEIVTNNAIIGPYPEKSELIRLKEKFHITTDISLLTPSLPQEKSLLEEESKWDKELGLKFYNFPMEYFDLKSQNNYKMVIAIIKFIKQHPNEKFYIHCYLGKNRVGLVKKILIKDYHIEHKFSKNHKKLVFQK